jgi:hypothetical protein
LKRFAQYIEEIFNQPFEHDAEPTVKKRGKTQVHVYRFKAGDHPDAPHYDLEITHKKNKADAAFYDHTGDVRMNSAHPRDAHRIIGTAHHILRRHVENNPEITHLTFAAAHGDQGRTKLYHHLAHKMSPGKVRVKSDDVDGETRYTMQVRSKE